MQKCICDICGIDEPQRHYKIKEKRIHGYQNRQPLFSWARTDICDKCFENLAKLRYEQDLEKRIISFGCGRYEKLYPDDVDLQSAYLTGVQDVLDILLQNKVVKQEMR